MCYNSVSFQSCQLSQLCCLYNLCTGDLPCSHHIGSKGLFNKLGICHIPDHQVLHVPLVTARNCTPNSRFMFLSLVSEIQLGKEETTSQITKQEGPYKGECVHSYKTLSEVYHFSIIHGVKWFTVSPSRIVAFHLKLVRMTDGHCDVGCAVVQGPFSFVFKVL